MVLVVEKMLLKKGEAIGRGAELAIWSDLSWSRQTIWGITARCCAIRRLRSVSCIVGNMISIATAAGTLRNLVTYRTT